jgi:hypothetical protein
MFQGEKNNNKLFFYFISLETFQSRWGYSIAIVDDSYVAASVGWKCFKEKKILKNLKIFYFIFQIFFKVPRDPRIAVGDDGYAAASVRLICFKGK